MVVDIYVGLSNLLNGENFFFYLAKTLIALHLHTF